MYLFRLLLIIWTLVVSSLGLAAAATPAGSPVPVLQAKKTTAAQKILGFIADTEWEAQATEEATTEPAGPVFRLPAALVRANMALLARLLTPPAATLPRCRLDCLAAYPSPHIIYCTWII